MKPLKQKKCRVCGEEYTPYSSLQKVCGPKCSIEYVNKDKARKALKQAQIQRKRHREDKERIKTRAQWLKEAQAEFNKYVRLRDEKLPCISCGRHHDGQYHAGHYLSTGSSPELRYHPFNNNKQCAPCNNHLSGNIVHYRPRLIEKIGLENVEWLEGQHQAQKWTIDEIKEIKQYYKEQIKHIRGE